MTKLQSSQNKQVNSRARISVCVESEVPTGPDNRGGQAGIPLARDLAAKRNRGALADRKTRNRLWMDLGT